MDQEKKEQQQQKKSNKKKWWIIGISAFVFLAIIGKIIEEPQQAEKQDKPPAAKEEKQEKEEPKEKPEPSKNKPEISEHAKEMTIDFITDDPLVKDAHIEVKGDKVTIAIIVNAAMNEERAKEVGDNSVRFLNTMVDGTEPATKHYLGSLWDHYDLHVGVGTGPDHFIAQGAKVKGAPRIVW